MLNEAIDALKAGQVIVYPTEAIFGLGCDPFNAKACQRIAEIKNRQNKAGFICVIGCIEQLATLIEPLTTADMNKLTKSWRGHVSWILPAKKTLPPWLIGPNNTICVRYSNHPTIQNLCNSFDGAIISTSANLQGQKPASSIHDAQLYFGNTVDYYLDQPLGCEKSASKIYNLNYKKIR